MLVLPFCYSNFLSEENDLKRRKHWEKVVDFLLKQFYIFVVSIRQKEAKRNDRKGESQYEVTNTYKHKSYMCAPIGIIEIYLVASKASLFTKEGSKFSKYG